VVPPVTHLMPGSALIVEVKYRLVKL